MRKSFLAAAGAALALVSTAVSAQSAQERLDARYDRALAAGYKALFVCSALANSEANGASPERTPESIHEWELTGIYPALDPIIRDMSYEIVRWEDGLMSHVAVKWADDMPPRFAEHNVDRGCSVLPVGASTPTSDRSNPMDFGIAPFPAFFEPTGPDLAVAKTAFDASTYGEGSRTTAVMIVHKEEVVAEQYADGFGPYTPQRTWSVAKSIAATLVGAAVQRGEADVDESARLGTSDDDPRRAITVDHALRMASGRYSDTAGNRTDPLYWGGTSVEERAQNWPSVAQPNTVYRYANNDTLAAVQAIEGTFDAHPPAELFAILGMDNTVAETDWQGNYVLSSQAWTTARDLARLGQLYLNDGMWNDVRILPEGWAAYVSDPSGPQPQGTNWGYGAGWWTFRRPEGNAFEGIPDDAFAARGNRGQYVVVVPSRDVVIVRRGEDMVGTRFDIAAFTRDVLAALPQD